MNMYQRLSAVRPKLTAVYYWWALSVVSLLCLGGSGYAQGVFDYGASAPVPGGGDISQLVGGHDNGGSYYVDSGNPGQTFTTASNPSGYSLLNLYIKTRSSGAGGGQPGLTAYTLRIYSMTAVGSGTATLMTTYITTNQATFVQGDWLKFSGLTNVLQPNNIYAFALSRNGSGYWEPDNSSSDLYAGGLAARMPTATGAIGTTYPSSDMAFDLNLIPSSDPLVSSTAITPVNPVYVGQTATLSATFGGTAPFTVFDWQSDGGSGGASWTDLPGSITNSYSLNTASMTPGSYKFRLIVTGGAGVTTNAPATMVLNAQSAPTGLTTISPSSAVAAGYVITLSASLTGNPPISGYQWQFSDGATFTNNITGATSSTYTIYDAATTNSGYYRLTATNSLGTGASAFVQLTVTNTFGSAQIIDAGPGTPVTYSADIVQLSTSGNTQSPGGLNYYWTDNNPAPGQTFGTGLNPSGYALNALYYQADGTASGVASYILQLYSITNGTNATLIGAYTNSVNLAITTGDWLKWIGITNVLSPNTLYAYSVRGIRMEIYNTSGNPYAGGQLALIKPNGGTGALNYGTATNFDGTFVLQLAPLSGAATAPSVLLDTAISPATVTAGYPVTMSVGVSGSSPISYQWQFSDLATFTNNIYGATNSSYTIYNTATSNTGYYSVVATNSVGATNSSFALLTVNPITDVEIINFGSAAPTTSSNDIAQLSTTGNQGAPAGLNYYDDNGNPPGQTFTTGGNVYGYAFNSLYVQMGTIGGGHVAGGVYTLRLYSVNGAGSATLISTYVNNNTAPAINTGNWTKWIGLNNVLAPNTTYAYTISAANVGYLQVANTSGNPYSGGQVCLIPVAGGTVNYGTDANEDGTFIVPLNLGPIVPDFAPILTSDTAINPSGVLVGGNATMSAAFNAIPAATYQWMFNNGSGPVVIPGATNASYTLVNAQLANTGAYFVVASNNPNGSPATLASSPAQFIVSMPPQVNTSSVVIADAGTSIPPVGTNDITQVLVTSPLVNGPTTVPGINYYVNNSAPPGQTFTTSNNPPSAAGYPLTSVYVQEELSSAANGGTNVQSYTLGIYQVTGSNAVLLTKYTTVNSLGIIEGDWIQFSGLTNLLQPNTTYAFSIHNNGSGSWKLSNSENPFDPSDSANDVYPGGQVAVLPNSGIGAMTFSTDPTIDAAFVVSLTPGAAPTVLQDTHITPSIAVAGSNVVMSAFFNGAAPLSYQWQFTDTNGVGPTPIAGATNSTFTITGAHLANSGSYNLVAVNNIGTNISTATSLTVVPMILTQNTTITPVGAYTNANIPVTIKAAFNGLGIVYQWMFDNGSGPIVIPGATNATYSISNFSATNVGNYFLVASNNPDGIPSVLASTSTLLAALTIPSDLLINFAYTYNPPAYNGAGVITSVSGGTYWNQLQGVNVGSATNVTSLAPDGGTYLGIGMSIGSGGQAANGGNPASASGLLTYYILNNNAQASALPFTFTGLPQGAYNLVMYSVDGAYNNAHTTFVVGNQTNTANANNSSTFIQNNNYVVFNNIVVTNGTLGGSYWFPGNHEGAFNGAQLQLAYSFANPRIFISSQPSSNSVPIGYQASVSVAAQGPGQLSYQWWSTNGVTGAPISGATNSSYIVNTSSAGTSNYYVVITNLTGLTTNSTVATITVYAPDTLSWRGATGSAWDLSTLNWSNVSQQVDGVAYQDPDVVVFDDSAVSFIVSNVLVLMPSSVTMNNNLNNYTLTGTGSMSGLMGLTMDGRATLTINTKTSTPWGRL